MALVDEQGRLFGRVNLLDAVLGVLVLGLIPLAFASYALFKVPPPVLSAVEPATFAAGPNLRVTIRGENLRPYMRISFGTHQGFSFLFASPTVAQVELGDIPPGVYDVVLYDYAQERARLPKALTITPSPLPETQVIVVGGFGNLKAAEAAQISNGMVIGGFGEVVHVGRPIPEATRVYAGSGLVDIPVDAAVRVPAVLRVGCHVRAITGRPECITADVVLQPTALLMLPTPLGPRPFQIDQIRGLQPLEPVQVTVRFVGVTGVIAQIKKGDVDRGVWVNELAAGGTVQGVGAQQALSEQMAQRDVDLLVQAQRGPGGWTYAGSPLRLGTSFYLRTPLYELQGSVISLTPHSTAPAAAGQ